METSNMTTIQASQLMTLAIDLAEKHGACLIFGRDAACDLWIDGAYAGLQARGVPLTELSFPAQMGGGAYARGWRVGFSHLGDEA